MSHVADQFDPGANQLEPSYHVNQSDEILARPQKYRERALSGGGIG